MEKERISNVISEEQIKGWNPNFGKCKQEPLIIKAQTDSGKSWFVKNKLYEIAKINRQKILFLVNREPLKDEFTKEIVEDKKDDIITVACYQKLENYYVNNKGDYMDLSEYDYIVSDESHYFLQDSTFNELTQVSFETINNHKNSFKIYMSATNDLLLDYFDYFQIPYEKLEMSTNYDYIKSLSFFNKQDCIAQMMEELIKSNEKCIIFIQDIEQAIDLYTEFKDKSLFLCSKNGKHRGYRKTFTDEKLYEQMINGQGLPCQFLITTTVFENGNNIKDPDLHHMIIQLNDITSIQQAIGRKRMTSDDDYLHLAICNLGENRLTKLIAKNESILEGANLMIDEGKEAYTRTYGRINNPIVYTRWNKELDHEEYAINSFMYFKATNNVELYTKWKNNPYHTGFKLAILQMLDNRFKLNECLSLDGVYEAERIKNIIKKFINDLLTKDKKKDLISQLNLKNDGHVIKSADNINKQLEKYRIHYRIIDDRCYVNGKRQRVWIIKKLD